MNRRQLILTLVAGATLSLHAQHYVNPNEASLYKEEAARLTEEEFYYGSQNLKATKDEAPDSHQRLLPQHSRNTAENRRMAGCACRAS